ncbi:MAG: HlyD family efflux transporter periplasmic adaptor subunit [Eubacteriales bacterium]|nr:HlyD family efflux transporter periplasmic adaptor subunit [Eubacteriales bacterium]
MAKKKKKNRKIVRYRRPVNMNVGMIIFAIIFVYMAFSVYTYMKKERIQFYEVVEGNIVNDHQHTGIVLRQERVENTDRSGYINYYIREGKRAAVGTRIYSIDETGSMASFLEDNPEANITLTDANLSDIKRQLSSFAMNYDGESFSEAYDLQYTLEAAVLEYVNFNSLGNLDAMMQQTGITLQQVTSPVSGVISYAIDGFESMTPEQITAEAFDRSGYSKAITKAGRLIEQDAPVYKLVTSDDWSVVFPLTEDMVSEYTGKNRLHVTFSSNTLETDAPFSIVTGADGGQYGKLDFTQYMVQFVSDRYVTFEVDMDNADGLKIPVTAVTTKDFYLVPAAYMTQGGDSSGQGFLKEIYTENGTAAEFVPATIYYSTEDYYYIDMGENAPLKAGDYVVKPDSQDRYQIGSSASLQGVYNINKGYAVFKQIEIIGTNDEYYTIEKGTSYGLSVYDHIVLNADTVYEGQLIYQ